MDRAPGLTLRTERLVLREAEEADLEALHDVFTSDPKLDVLRPDIAAAGGYDLASVRQYWEGAQLDPRRHLLVIGAQPSGTIVGLIDFVTESPADGCPWIGLVLIHGDHQRRHFGAEALAAVAANLAGQGHVTVRMAVLEDNAAGLAFAHAMGFTELTDVATPSGRRAVMMELGRIGSGEVPLAPGPST